VNGVGMDEGDLEPEEPDPRLLVDQGRARGRKAAELGAHVGDLVGDVVHPRAPAGEELADGSLVVERCEQLDASGADEHGRRLDTLVLDQAAVLELGTEQPDIGLEGLVQVLDGHAEMVNAACDHAADANGGLVLDRGERAYRADRFG